MTWSDVLVSSATPLRAANVFGVHMIMRESLVASHVFGVVNW